LLWEPAKEGNVEWIDTFTLSAEQNPYIQAESDDMDFYMLGMNKEERDIREKGEFVARSGLVFPDFSQNIEQYLIDFGPGDVPKDWAIYASVDHGLNNPTAWLWHAVAPTGEIVTFAEHYQSNMIVSEHAKVVKSREESWGRNPENVERMGDPAMRQRSGITGTSIIQEYALHGVYVNVEGIPHDVMVGIEKMQAYMRRRPKTRWGADRPTWVISKNCPNLIRELKKLRWATYSSDKMAYEMNKQEVVHKKDDHAFDSARYFATTRPDLKPIPEQTDANAPPVTLRYEELLLKMREDPTVEFAEDRASAQDGNVVINDYGGYY